MTFITVDMMDVCIRSFEGKYAVEISTPISRFEHSPTRHELMFDWDGKIVYDMINLPDLWVNFNYIWDRKCLFPSQEK